MSSGSSHLKASSLDTLENSYQKSQGAHALHPEGSVVDENGLSANKSRRSILGFVAILAFCGVAALGFTSTNLTEDSISTENYMSFAVAPSSRVFQVIPKAAMQISASNDYGPFLGDYSFEEKYPGYVLGEPYTTTIFTIKGSFTARPDYSYKWFVDGHNNGQPYEGSRLEFAIIGQPGIYPIQVDVYSNSDRGANYVSSYQTHLIVKYVKRELRSLTKTDRERFLDAASTLWRVSTPEGREKYGEKYTSITTLVAEHAKASSDIRCDQYHEGSAFLTHHLALQNTFEASLRSVDPRVTLPYWDFTMEGERISQAGKAPSYILEISPIFTDMWFGSVDKDHHIANSRWKDSRMPRQSDPEGVRNSYGFIRSYWNNNNDEYITRSMFSICGFEDTNKPIPTCAAHYNVLNLTSLGLFQILSAADGHGPLHVQSGGVFGGCEKDFADFLVKWGGLLDRDMTAEEIIAAGYTEKQFQNKWGTTAQRRAMFEKAIVGEFFHVYRSLWRSHMCSGGTKTQLLQCPDTCEANVPIEECKCTIPTLETGETRWEEVFDCLLNSDENKAYFKSTMPTELLKDLVHLFATTTVKEGEMLESASPADILFWMIHPVLERLLAAKRLPKVTMFGGTPFGKWNDPNTEPWLQYSYYTQAAGENKFFPEEYVCEGHAAGDPARPTSLPLTHAMDRFADKDGDGVVSNLEFYLALDPNNVEGNDYVFDHFSWDHCATKLVPDEEQIAKSLTAEEFLKSIIKENSLHGY